MNENKPTRQPKQTNPTGPAVTSESKPQAPVEAVQPEATQPPANNRDGLSHTAEAGVADYGVSLDVIGSRQNTAWK
jgi:hypothetical protein